MPDAVPLPLATVPELLAHLFPYKDVRCVQGIIPLVVPPILGPAGVGFSFDGVSGNGRVPGISHIPLVVAGQAIVVILGVYPCRLTLAGVAAAHCDCKFPNSGCIGTGEPTDTFSPVCKVVSGYVMMP